MGISFIGMRDEYEERLESLGYTKDGSVKSNEISKLDYEAIEPLSDEMLLLLRQTRNRHDPYTVYMQNDESFYDAHYNDDPDEVLDEEEDNLLEEAKAIRRLYRSYPKYAYACYIRDLYMDSIIEKYGGIDAFRYKAAIGSVDEWIPPVPILVNTAPDYDDYLAGILRVGDFDWDDISLEETMDEWIDDKTQGIDPASIEIVATPETDIHVIRLMEMLDTMPSVVDRRSYANCSHKIGGVSANDLLDIQAMFNQWYVEENKSPNDNEDRGFFSETPEKIIQNFYGSGIVDMRGQLTKVLSGEEIEEVYDPNEMVIDEKTRRPMTRADYNNRKFISMMEENGWSGPRLMRLMKIGSKHDQKIAMKKEQRKNKSTSVSKGIYNYLTGESDINSIETASSVEELRGLLYGDE